MGLMHLLAFIFFIDIFESRVHQLLEGPHFHDLLQDLPTKLRSHSLIAFYNKSCESRLNKLNFNQHDLPGVHDLMLGKYEMSTFDKRVWYDKEPHIDLAGVLGVYDYISSHGGGKDTCPTLAFVPVSYADEIGFWYKTFPDKTQIQFWDYKTDWRQWAWNLMKETVPVFHDKPIETEITVTRAGSQSVTKTKKDQYKLEGFESHVDIEVYPGDEIQITAPATAEVYENGQSRIPRSSITAYPGIKTLEIETNPHSRATEFNYEPHAYRLDNLNENWARQRHGTTMMTHVRNLMLPMRVPKHDKMGFKKIKMPDQIFERLKQYYRVHWAEQRDEEWDNSGTQLNFFSVKTTMVSLDNDWEERDRIADLIRPVLEEWAGGQSLEMTAFYGIREYYRGASLRNHVDRVDTHIFSAICQISQTGIDSDWPLEVYGFDGKNYEINLKPGEMILYEGAALIHGRPRPFNGTRFANAFVHFRPVGWDYNSNKLWAMNTKPQLRDLEMDWNSIYA